MNNPFAQHKSNTGLLIAGATFGAVAVATAAWFYFKNKLVPAGVVPEHLDAPYHKQTDHKPKKKTAVGELHTIVPGTHAEHEG